MPDHSADASKKVDLSKLPEWARKITSEVTDYSATFSGAPVDEYLVSDIVRLRDYAAEQQALKEEAIWAGAGKLRALNIAKARVKELEATIQRLSWFGFSGSCSVEAIDEWKSLIALGESKENSVTELTEKEKKLILLLERILLDYHNCTAYEEQDTGFESQHTRNIAAYRKELESLKEH